MPVVGAAFLLAVDGALARIHVQHDDPGWSPLVVHVIYAHPLADSFAAALHARIVAALGRSGHQVDDCDLYSEVSIRC